VPRSNACRTWGQPGTTRAAQAPGNLGRLHDGSDTAPSKRIISVIPEYDGRKASAGPDIAEYIGVSAIRAKCPHFDGWLTQLENLKW
jgi:Domain of unknown function (DUF4276)